MAEGEDRKIDFEEPEVRELGLLKSWPIWAYNTMCASPAGPFGDVPWLRSERERGHNGQTIWTAYQSFNEGLGDKLSEASGRTGSQGSHRGVIRVIGRSHGDYLD